MSSKIIKQGFGFAVYPSVSLFGYKTDKKTGKKKFSFVKQLLFGDYIRPEIQNQKFVELEENGKVYIKVRARNASGYILPENIQPNRILEMNFIDVGQGDSCHIVTPDDKHFIIDAGVSDNMYRFFKWRFNLNSSKVSPPPLTAVITHSDTDHYKGFNKLFTKQSGDKRQFQFNKIYHNGLVETSGKTLDTLGKLVKNESYITNLIDTNSQFEKFVSTVEKPGMYIQTLTKSTAPKTSLRFGSPPIYKKGNAKIEAIGPVAKRIGSKDALPVFEDKGKTKNGNSIVLKISIGNFKAFLGGDLNFAAEKYLLWCYSKIDVSQIKDKLQDKSISPIERKALEKKLNTAISKSRKYLESDIAKSCHHGSPYITPEFLLAVNAIATIISSGDEESHCHPRPVTLGLIGKYNQRDNPLIYSTELARSGKEFINLDKLPANTKKIRTVTVYGMINVRTDGEKIIVAQKLEKKVASRNWYINKLEWNEKKSQFEFIEKKR